MADSSWRDFKSDGGKIGLYVSFWHTSPKRGKTTITWWIAPMRGYNWYSNPGTNISLKVNGKQVYSYSGMGPNLVHNEYDPLGNYTGTIEYTYNGQGAQNIPFEAEISNNDVNYSHRYSDTYVLPALSAYGGEALTGTVAPVLGSTTLRLGEANPVAVTYNKSANVDTVYAYVSAPSASINEELIGQDTKPNGSVSIPISLARKMFPTGNVRQISGSIVFVGYDKGIAVTDKVSVPVTIQAPVGMFAPTVTGVSVIEGKDNIKRLSIPFIQGVSEMKFSMSATPVSGSSIVAYNWRFKERQGFQISHTSNIYVYPSVSLNFSGDYTLQGQAVDNYGYASDWVDGARITVLPYQAPRVISTDFRRNETQENKVDVLRNFSSTNVSHGTFRNEMTVIYDIQEVGKPNTKISKTENSVDLLRNGVYRIDYDFDTVKSYEIKTRILDKFSSVELEWVRIGPIKVPFDISSHGIGVGTIAQENGKALQVASGAHIESGLTLTGGLNVSGDITSRSNILLTNNAVYKYNGNDIQHYKWSNHDGSTGVQGDNQDFNTYIKAGRYWLRPKDSQCPFWQNSYGLLEVYLISSSHVGYEILQRFTQGWTGYSMTRKGRREHANNPIYWSDWVSPNAVFHWYNGKTGGGVLDANQIMNDGKYLVKPQTCKNIPEAGMLYVTRTYTKEAYQKLETNTYGCYMRMSHYATGAWEAWKKVY